MLQRFKSAIDGVLAEEQERERARINQQAQARSSASARRSTLQNTRSPNRPPRQGARSVSASDAALGGSGPEPSPSSFETDTIAEEDGAGITSAPKTPDEASETANNGDGAEVGTTASSEGKEAGTVSHDGSSDSNLELPVDVRSKLRKLTKLEAKYQELLRAYRKAHARNSAIEPFEAKLRENTPLTTITDPGAFVEYLNQMALKSEMVMHELKSVSTERNNLQDQLDEAERRTREAWDEVAQLKKLKEPSSPPTDESIPITENRDEAGESSSSVGGVMLSEATKHRDSRISELEAEVLTKSEALSRMAESANKAKADMEAAKEQLSSLQVAKSSTETELRQQCVQLEEGKQALQGRLETARAELEEHKTRLQTHEVASAKLQTDLESAREELRSMKLTASASGVNNSIGDANENTQVADSADPSATAGKKKKNKKKKKGNASSAALDGNDASIATLASHTKDQQNSEDDIVSLKRRTEEQDAIISGLTSKLKDQEDLKDEIETLKDDLIHVGQEHVQTKDELKEAHAERATLRASIADLEKEVAELRERNPSRDASLQIDASRGDAWEEEKRTLSATVKDLESQIATLAAVRDEMETVRAENKTLEQTKAVLEQRLEELRTGQASKDTQSASARTALQAEVEELRLKATSLQTDLTAAQQLAASRFRDLSELRERHQRLQPELTSLRADVSDLRASKEEQATRLAEARKLEARQTELRAETASLRKEVVEREVEIKSLKQKWNEESDQREIAEEAHRKTQRNLQRVQKEKTDAMSAKEETSRSLQKIQAELEQYKKLEDQIAQLNRDNEALREDVDLKSAQYASAQSLMSSLQDQTTEMAAQNKETRERCDSLEDELTEVCRQRDGRSREAETMRRLLAEVEGRAESRIKAMKDRLDGANEERDRAEDEASTIGRRRAKELEDLKTRLRDAERDLKEAQESKADYDRMKEELQESHETKDRQVSEATLELSTAKASMKNLQDILEDGEAQIKDLETEKTELKRTLDELQSKLEKQQKSNKTLADELRTLRATKLRSSDSPDQSTRSSLDSSSQASRVMSPPMGNKNSPRPTPNTAGAAGGGSAVDYGYLKQILLQFVEQKDRKHQLQLVPVLGMLLHFDKKDEQKWAAAIAAR